MPKNKLSSSSSSANAFRFGTSSMFALCLGLSAGVFVGLAMWSMEVLSKYEAAVWSSHSVLGHHLETVFRINNNDNDNNQNDNNRSASKATIAYAITMTSCSPSSTKSQRYIDGAAVLSWSIHRNSIRNKNNNSSKYDYKLYAFVHPDAVQCSDALATLGYDVQVRPLPVRLDEIRGPLKTYVDEASCCGAAEFLKLYSYTLMQHPVVVHLDTDSLLLRPLDDLLDVMLLDVKESSSTTAAAEEARRRLPIMWTNQSLPERIDGFFTRDYNMMVPNYRTVEESAVQGGFLVLRPSLEYYELLRETIREGDYDPGTGWGHSKKLRYGGFFGAPQVQGILAYMFGHLVPGTAVELDRCLINSMVDDPIADEPPRHAGKCRESRCRDCRLTNVTDVMLAHFTICGKPWWCQPPARGLHGRLCGEFHREWFRYRHEMETAWASRSLSYQSTEQRVGMNWTEEEGKKVFCSGGYQPILYPDRLVVKSVLKR